MLKVEKRKDVNPKDYFKDSKHIIVYAFSIGERHYFRFDDVFNIPYQRGLQCIVYYKELGMNVDAEFLVAHTQAFDNALKQPKITIDTLIELKKLNDQLKQRMSLPKEPELMYKLASVVYFDQNERPEVYEFKYGENKIKSWKQNVSMQSFFLSKPLRELIPYLEHAGADLITFSRLTEKATKEHLDNLLPMLSEEQRIAFTGKSALSLAQ